MKKTTITFLVLFVTGLFAVNAQDYMGIVGDATPIGFTPTGLAMAQDSGNPDLFTYEGVLKPGRFKFHLVEADWCVGEWLNAGVEDQDLASNNYITTTGCDGPDNQWLVSTSGSYSIVVDLGLETISISTLPYYPNLYLVGDATPNGWNMDNATPMTVDSSNPALFTWTGPLVAGEFKISTAKSFDDGWDWIHPVAQAQDLTLDTYEILAAGSGSDNKWVISNPDDYTFTLNLQNATLQIEQGTLSVDNFHKIEMYPNPVSQFINLDFKNIVEAKAVIFDAKGSKIYEKKLNSSSNYLDLSNLNVQGLLFLQITSETYSETFKIIKK
ncbi:SusF/SusE family outer membrane protein [Subsaximicrobium wynnwilliamsii]|uniref:SusF/SusE family outer membrane protein n=1 Tax=Subsaximicrobium wynnwilliamsii TaxID=291179 RepID=A0A5C6ZEE1_9FLAO|nr:SusF/SusE family outer membrane protein [Subsaximicrobium wynnwilliamsii]TXD82664.1 SusF/SusE family outer membrane protein [Subsaximicrobium wynnwilliamsii]TXD88399.1 SusF/SusE family outer membrane protein [Subsaximicrobium wynnwilliamsii]TXE02326.1 SusF/SusE family outer membrane protein [Subsaximicrobium wynnwilliamsii]